MTNSTDDSINHCPHCGEEKEICWNWVHGRDGKWYHECWKCENVFETDEKVNENEKLND